MAWSLSVEMAFYVLLPVYALLMAKLLGGRDRDSQARLELRLLVASAVAAIAMRTVGEPDLADLGVRQPAAGDLDVVHRRPRACRRQRLAGAPAAERAAARRAHLTERPVACWAIAFALLTIAAWFIGLDRDPFAQNPTFSLQAQHVLYAGMAFFLVAPMVFHDGRRSLPATLLSTRALAWLGLVSYGIFLYHQAFVVRLPGHAPVASVRGTSSTRCW